ncbi:hypothetical protein [Caldalkalibacillus salinus]|uniref:hypothetical protein n=1 Tax=Caldalkalibacillus salinus TaxID=2803787 RepID=UPI001924BB28|nr:hypothetical protein [Caldalkalibacillus salinus]
MVSKPLSHLFIYMVLIILLSSCALFDTGHTTTPVDPEKQTGSETNNDNTQTSAEPPVSEYPTLEQSVWEVLSGTYFYNHGFVFEQEDGYQPVHAIGLGKYEIDAHPEDTIDVRTVEGALQLTIPKPEDYLHLTQAFLSPDREMIVLSVTTESQSTTYYLNPTEGLVSAIGEGDHIEHPTWAPDGHCIAFAYGTEQGETIAIYDLENSVITPLTEESFNNIVGVKWSEDGSFIDFVIKQEDNHYPYCMVRYELENEALDIQYALSNTEFADWIYIY